jgi:histidine triad (HIT) family protein
MAMRRAAEPARRSGRPSNLITSRGRDATQSVFRLHVRLIFRAEGDGLALPWDSGRRA